MTRATPPSGSAPPPVNPAPPVGCPGSDPFASLPTLIGRCVNGDWIPAAAVSPQALVIVIHTLVPNIPAIMLAE